MEDNMKLWNEVKSPPPEVLKPIRGGRLKGMTDIKPQWRYQVMTEQFGPCGSGWYYTIDKQWTETVGDETLCFCNVSLYVTLDGEWSKPIPGTGGSKLGEMERAGLHANDEGYKMALTDALSVAMTRLGVASDIYMGLGSGSKYEASEPPVTKPAPKKANGKNGPVAQAHKNLREAWADCPEAFLVLLEKIGKARARFDSDADHREAIMGFTDGMTGYTTEQLKAANEVASKYLPPKSTEEQAKETF